MLFLLRAFYWRHPWFFLLRSRSETQSHLRSQPQNLRFPWRLKERKAGPPFPRLRTAQRDLVLQCHIMDSSNHRLITWIALLEPGKIPEIGTRGENHVDSRHAGNLLRVIDTYRRFNHDHHHHVFVDGLMIIGPVQRTVLPHALAAASLRRIPRPLYRSLGFFDGIHRWNDDAQRPDVRRFLDVAFGSIRHADKRHGLRAATGPDHLRDVAVRQRAVLHFNPGVVISGIRKRTVDIRIGRRDGDTDYLLASGEFLFGGVVDLGGRRGLILSGHYRHEHHQPESCAYQLLEKHIGISISQPFHGKGWLHRPPANPRSSG